MKYTVASLALVSLLLSACGGRDNNDGNGKNSGSNKSNETQVEVYGKLDDGTEVKIFTFSNKSGMVAKVTEYGAILTSLEVPDKDGNVEDVTHGYDNLAGWLTNSSYFGATVGRYGNRIAGGKFEIDGQVYDQLAVNNGPNHLHGGEKGFDKVLWKGEAIDGGVKLTYTSKDGEEGYPGNLQVTVTYTLNDNNELKWVCEATTDKATPVNIVQHTYWNLSGDPTTSINDHILTIPAKYFLTTDKDLIPDGNLAEVVDTPFDFNSSTTIGERIKAASIPLQFGKGYDHCWVVDGEGMRLAAKLRDPKTRRAMELQTDQPGVQFYGGNFLDGETTGKSGVKYGHRTACCLETQVFPDSPNKQDNPAFPSCILKPGETYTHTMVSKFSW
ncbi:MAG: aldose epimerase family protein [Roseibacillus sp.]|nr:galactose-1-epimerase [Verrucomicrobiales bacterium]